MSAIRRSLRLSTASVFCVSAVAIASTQAVAQTSPSASQESSSGRADQDRDRIVVTGSRIARPELTSEQPVQNLDGGVVNDRGYPTIAEALNNLPISGTPESPRGAQGDNIGRNYVNLFNLGSQRTLTLVNGRRFVSSNPASGASLIGGNQVDLNNIPSGFIERVEIVEATGAATYGSDAIAGVANIILKDDFEGLEVDGQYGVTDKGDAQTYRFRVTGGTNFADDRGNVSLSFERSDSDGLRNSDREWGRGYSFFPNPANTGPDDGIPSQIFLCCRRIQELTLGGLPYVANSYDLGDVIMMPDPSNPSENVMAQFGPDGNLIPYDAGTPYTIAGAVGGDGWDTNGFTNLIAPVERNVLYGMAHYDLTDNVRVFTELSSSWISARESSRQGGAINTSLAGAPNNAVLLSTDNPFLSSQARAIIENNGVTEFYLSRFNSDVLPGESARTSKVKTRRAVFGLEGDFAAGDREFYWNVFGNYGVSKGDTSYTDIHTQRFIYAVDAVEAPNGDIVCNVTLANPGSVDQDIAGCQPLNLFGVGAPDAAAQDYVTVLLQQTNKQTQTNFQANISGDLFTLPAGEVGFSLGYEYRKEKSEFDGNEARLRGYGRTGSIVPLSGSINTHEAYSELLIPLVGEDFTLPLVQSLEVQAAARYTEHSLAGGDWAWNLGGRWKPVEGVTFRASKSRTFRAPSAFELFLPRQIISQSTEDPCDFRYINTGNNPAARLANCQALFVANGFPANTDFTSIRVGNSFPVTFGGNTDLKNEVADSWTVGMVLEPAFAPGLTLTLDHVSIFLSDAIVNFNSTAIARTCYDADDPDPTICGLITRGGDLQIQDVFTGFVNAGFTRFKAISVTGNYAFPLDSVISNTPGDITINVNALNTRRLETSVSGLGYDLDVAAGEFNAPHWKGQLNVSYANGPLSVSWYTHYVGSAVADVLFTVENRDILGAGAVYRHDISASYTLSDHLVLRAGVYNLLDKEPEYGTTTIGLSATNGGNIDVIGRRFFAGATMRF